MRSTLALLALSMALTLAACKPAAPVEEAEDRTPTPTTADAPATDPSGPAPTDPGAGAAPASDDNDATQTNAYRVVGTEPFWGVEINGGTLQYTWLENQQGVTLQAQRAVQADGVQYTGSHAGKSFTLTLKNGKCSDGMSDDSYDLSAVFLIDGKTLKGCANPAG